MKRLNHPSARSWICFLAAAEGIDFERLSLTEAADCAISQLERQRDAGLALRPESVQFAALLVRLAGEMAASGETSAEPFIERAYARARARRLGEQYEAGLRTCTNPGALPQDKPEPELDWVSVYDLYRQAQSIARDLDRMRRRRAAARHR